MPSIRDLAEGWLALICSISGIHIVRKNNSWFGEHPTINIYLFGQTDYVWRGVHQTYIKLMIHFL